MNVTRDVILDLLPVYLSGDASAETRALVEEFLARDADLARRVSQMERMELPEIAGSPSPDLQLRTLRRTRGKLRTLRWLFALGWVFLALSLSLRITDRPGTPVRVRLLWWEHPAVLAGLLAASALCWLLYFRLKRTE